MQPTSLFYLAIGNITEDLLPDGTTTPGGTVSFSALTAHRLGNRAAIIASAPAYFRQLPIFNNIEITGQIVDKATMFVNIYTPNGRVQYVKAVAPPIDPADIPEAWTHADIVHLGPIAQECSIELAARFKDSLIGITPQGWMRKWDAADGLVQPILWEGAEKILSRASALVLSEEDLPLGETGKRLLESYIAHCPVVAYTHGSRGCTVFWEGRSERVPAYKANEVDPTGAGDVFATAFFLKLRETKNPVEAARFGNAAAAVNIESPGLSGAPTLPEVEARLRQSPLE